MTGAVLDAETKQPIEGAYVIAAYKIQRAGLAAIVSWCVNTRGMYTGQDGKYHFPVEQLDGRSPFSVNAIKPGYFWKTTKLPDSEVWSRQDAVAYSGRDILLKKQDPASPDFHFSNGDEFCTHAPARGEAAAGAQFLKLKLAEVAKYGANEQKTSALEYMIQRLESLPAAAGSEK